MRLIVSRSDAANPVGERCRKRGDVIEILDDGQDAGILGEQSRDWWILDAPGADKSDYAHLLRSSEDDDGPSRLLKIDIHRLKARHINEDVAYLNAHKRLRTDKIAINYATVAR